MKIEVGQVLSIRMRFNNSGTISKTKHPYLVVKIIDESTIEVAQLDSLKEKGLWKAAMESNKVIYSDEPEESVIDKDSYIQMDNTFQLEYYDEMVKYRRQEEKLSAKKLADVIKAYDNYHHNHEILENKQVYISKNELEELNKLRV